MQYRGIQSVSDEYEYNFIGNINIIIIIIRCIRYLLLNFTKRKRETAGYNEDSKTLEKLAKNEFLLNKDN